MRKSCLHQLRRQAIVLVWGAAVLLGWLLAGAVAFGQDEGDRTADGRPEPIVLDPVEAANTVQLEPDAPPVAWNPLEIGDFELIDQLGRPVTRADLLGRPWVASFIFTRCVIECPRMADKIRELSERVKDIDVRFVTITVDPRHDTVARLKQFSDIFQADPERWLFLTGEKDAIDRLIRHGFKVAAWENFGTARLPGFEFVHSLALIHVDADGRVLGKYFSGDDQELLRLQRVLEGRMETPAANRPVPPAAVPPGPATIEGPPGLDALPAWAQRLPRTNASLNALATLLLLVGYAAIRARRVRLHVRTMLLAFGTSVAFLACYLVYHFALQHYTGTHGKPFEGTGLARNVYFTVLYSHVALAAAVPLLVLLTIYRAACGEWAKHRRIARVTFPIWLYVSVTGVIIYGMLYHW